MQSSSQTINGATKSSSSSEDLVFPPQFLWGVSTSAHQVEGGISNNQWCAWETEGRVERRMGSNHTCHYTLVAKKMGRGTFPVPSTDLYRVPSYFFCSDSTYWVRLLMRNCTSA